MGPKQREHRDRGTEPEQRTGVGQGQRGPKVRQELKGQGSGTGTERTGYWDRGREDGTDGAGVGPEDRTGVGTKQEERRDRDREDRVVGSGQGRPDQVVKSEIGTKYGHRSRKPDL